MQDKQENLVVRRGLRPVDPNGLDRVEGGGIGTSPRPGGGMGEDSIWSADVISSAPPTPPSGPVPVLYPNG